MRRPSAVISRGSLKLTTFGLLASTMLCASGAAFAQDDTNPPESGTTPTTTATDDDDEILITAQKRTENLQDVPMSVQALGNQQLEELNVANFTDYTKLMPSVSFQTVQPGSTNVYIRGVASGGDGNHSGSLPSVGVYLDEQPVTTIGGTLDVNIYDVARIEVLRGPQGTLYGASSEAGTIRIITNKPDTSGFYGAADAELNSVSHGGIGGGLEGFINAPLGDSVALRVVGWYRRDAGYIDNVPGTRTFLPSVFTGEQIIINNASLVEEDFNDVEVIGGRAALGIELNDNWTATASVLAQHQTADGVFGFDRSVGDLEVQRFFTDESTDRFVQAALTIEGRISNWDVTYAGAYLDRRTESISDYTDYAEAYDLLYADYGGVASYLYFFDDAGNLIDSSQHISGSGDYTKMSHELRVASPADNPFRVVAGLFYQRQTHLIHQDYQVTNLAADLSVNDFPGTLWLTQQERVDRDYAAFGEASYDITPTVTLTGGLRVYKYDNSLIGFFGFGRNPGNGFTDGPFNAVGSSRTGVIQCFTSTGERLRDNITGTLLPPAVPGSPCTNLGDFENGEVVPRNQTGSGFTHRLNLAWKVTPDHLLYATWSKGFRPGGINRRGTLPPYDEDTLTNYEIGFRTEWPGGLRVNGAIFWQEWSQFQFSFLGENSFTEIHNGPNARVRGIELEFFWRAARGLFLSGSAAYIDAETRENLCAFDDPTFVCATPGPQGQPNEVVSPAGTTLPITPRFKFNATARYEFPLAGGTGHVQGLVAHQGSSTADLRVPTAESLGRLDDYTTFDFAAGLELGRLRFEGFVQNLFDDRAELTRFQQCGQCALRTYIVTSPPRTIGVRVGTNF
jgi:iron complex outermembrane recepter protein